MHSVTKLPRQMLGVRFNWEHMPSRISSHIFRGRDGAAYLLNAGNPTISQKINSGDWIIETEFGCLYAVTHENFIKKYRMGHE